LFSPNCSRFPPCFNKTLCVSLKLLPTPSIRPESFLPEFSDRARATIHPDTACPASSIVRKQFRCGLSPAIGTSSRAVLRNRDAANPRRTLDRPEQEAVWGPPTSCHL